MSAKEREHLFEKFYRVKNKKQKRLAARDWGFGLLNN